MWMSGPLKSSGPPRSRWSWSTQSPNEGILCRQISCSPRSSSLSQSTPSLRVSQPLLVQFPKKELRKDSDTGFICTMRLMNPIKDNAGIHVQVFSCLGEPVAKNYYNEILTFSNTIYSVRQTTQWTTNGYYYCCTILGSNTVSKIYDTSIFLPIPDPYEFHSRDFTVSVIPIAVSKYKATFNNDCQKANLDPSKNDSGLAPEVESS